MSNVENNKFKEQILIKRAVVGLFMLVLLIGVAQIKPSVLGSASGTYVSKEQVSPKYPIQLRRFASKDPSQVRFTQINADPILGLVEELETMGAKVEMKEIEQSGVSSLKITVDGESLAPVVTNCTSCEPIVYEYEPIVFEYQPNEFQVQMNDQVIVYEY